MERGPGGHDLAPATSATTGRRPRWWQRDAGASANVVGLAWVVLAGVVALLPALVHGHALGPYDYLTKFGVTAQPGVVPHNTAASDQITQMIPWNTLDWTEVHHGQLPLWNPYSALGMPLAFNWQSAAFALPTLVGYLVPLSFSYTTTVIVTMLIAGIGVYVLGRALGLAVIACSLGAVAFELSGAFFGWLGWPIASVFSWAGWLFAAAVLIGSGRRRLIGVLGFGLALAAAVYAGQPDALVPLLAITAVFCVLLVVGRLAGPDGDARVAVRALIDFVVATVFGLMLAAPLLLPGLHVLNNSVRSLSGSALGAQSALPWRAFVGFFVGYDGLPGVTQTAIGSAVVVLAIAGSLVRRRRHAMGSLLGAFLVAVLLTFVEPVIRVANDLPGLHAVRWPRDVALVAFLVAVLAAVGLDALMRTETRDQMRRWLPVGFVLAAAGFVLSVTLSVGHDEMLPAVFRSPFVDGVRVRSEVWEAIEVAGGLVAAAVLWLGTRPRFRSPRPWRGLPVDAPLVPGVVLLVACTVSLVGLAAPVWASSPAPQATTPPERALLASVGSGTVGLGPAAGSCLAVPGLGMLPNSNVAVGLRQFAVYDPMTPRAYYGAWQRATGQAGGLTYISTFCPVVASVGVAQQFGVTDVLEAAGTPAPRGAVFERRIGSQDLYRIPRSGAASLVATSGGAVPPIGAAGSVVPVTHPVAREWRLRVSSAGPAVLRLHLTNTPGWTATIDGHPLALDSFDGIMLQARIPPGRHTITVRYWPRSFTEGLAVATLAVLGGLTVVVVDWRRRRRSGTKSPPRSGDSDGMVRAGG